MNRKSRGITMVELLIAVLVTAIVGVVLARYARQIPDYFRRLQSHHQINRESGTAIDTMTRLLRNARASSVQICSCSPNPCATCVASSDVPANSQINFITQDGHFRGFYWENKKLIMLDRETPTSLNIVTTEIAQDIIDLSFTVDYQDLATVTIHMKIQAPLDQTGTKTVTIPPQTVRLITAT